MGDSHARDFIRSVDEGTLSRDMQAKRREKRGPRRERAGNGERTGESGTSRAGNIMDINVASMLIPSAVPSLPFARSFVFHLHCRARDDFLLMRNPARWISSSPVPVIFGLRYTVARRIPWKPKPT